jgi:uncharacterized protein YbaP (TraB family)
MKNRIIYLLSVLSGFFLPHAHAENDYAARVSSYAPSAQQPAAIPQRGTLYKVERDGKTSYLFGTIHVGQPSFFPLEAEVTGALARAGKLVIETDIRETQTLQRALQKHGLYPPGVTIDRKLSDESLRQLRHTLDRYSIPFKSIAHMKPWLVTNMLVALDLERNGYQRSHGIEYFLLSQAMAQTKAVEELESSEYQLSLFDSMTEQEQEQYLRENLADIMNGTALKKARALIDAWAVADSKALDALLKETLSEKTATAAFFQRVLLDQRNHNMAEKIEGLLKKDETSFVGVGLFHLIGETGLPTLLRKKGYEVEKIY